MGRKRQREGERERALHCTDTFLDGRFNFLGDPAELNEE